MYMSIRTLDYVILLHQANLSKTTKHWDGFVSHCKTEDLSTLFARSTKSIIEVNPMLTIHTKEN